MNLCRFCGAPLDHTFVDLGMSPLCQKHLEPEELNSMERFYPLHVYICEKCLLVQLPEYVTPGEIFGDYAYFSSYSDTMLRNSKAYTDMVMRRFSINGNSQVVEIGSNDGYLLQYFAREGVCVLGVEPAANVARAAIDRGIPTLVRFFGEEAAREIAAEKGQADLLIGNNVLSQVPYLNDFVKGMKIILKPNGVITMEFHHLIRLMENNEFDSIYNEHFSYFSFFTVERVFAFQKLVLFDVEELPTHGGSLRIYAKHAEDPSKPVNRRVYDLKEKEQDAGMTRLETYSGFRDKVCRTKNSLLEFLIKAKREGKSIAGYGAPGKATTLLNFCGIRNDFVDYTVDRNPYKQGKYIGGTRIPICHPDRIKETKPDYLLILPWNLKDEIMEQNAYVRDWGGQFVVPIPEITVFP